MSAPWSGHFKDFGFLFLCLLCAVSDVVSVLDFPGPSTCLDDGIELSKPDDFFLSSWKRLLVVDATGGKKEACDLHQHGSSMTIPEKCIDYQGGRKIAYVSSKNLIYKITCHDYQADIPFGGTIIQCDESFITANVSRIIPGFSDEAVVEPPLPTWLLKIYTGNTDTTVSVAKAKALGYTLTSDDQNIMIRAAYNASGIQSFGNFYRGDIQLILAKVNPKIVIDVKIRCVKGPFPCDEIQMNVSIPQFDGTLQFINIDNVAIPIQSPATLQRHGLSLDLSSGTLLRISKDKLKAVPNTDQNTNLNNPTLYYLPPIVLVFLVGDVNVETSLNVAISLTGQCIIIPGPVVHICSQNGYMTVEVVSLLTKPSLDVRTVILGDGQCKPDQITDNAVKFNFSVTACGTTMRFEGGKLIYENNVHALWKDHPRKISRDSELRETVRCLYNISDQLPFSVTVQTPSPPPVSKRYDGPISFVLNLYQDDSYEVLYQDNQYPVVKTLRDPIYLEVQVLNRKDENLELVLNDCWATTSPDPTSSPQWNVVVDGCQENKDDYLTVFHTVSNVALPQHRKRFEVKAFEFVMGGDVSTNFVFFHCTALICSTRSPDYSLCTKSCPGSRRKRDELFLNRRSVLASLPGPLLFVASDPAMALQDEYSAIKEITLGVLPAFGIVAVVILAVVLVARIKRTENC